MAGKIVCPMSRLSALALDTQRAAHACDEMGVCGCVGDIDLVGPQRQEAR